MGDFNLFDARIKESGDQTVYLEEIAIFEKYGFTWSSQNIAQKGTKSTFVSHPFDILKFFTAQDREELEKYKKDKNYPAIVELCLRIIKRENLRLVYGNLDAVFTKNFQKARIKVTPHTFFNEKVVNTLKTDRDSFQAEYTAGLFKKSDKPTIPSDHFALNTKIESLAEPRKDTPSMVASNRR